MKKVLSDIITGIAVFILLWFTASFFQINAHNNIGDEPLSREQRETNLICIMCSVMFDN